jgi:transketolase
MRNAFAKEITKLSINNKKIILLSGDIGNKLFDKFKKKHKKRFINCGVAEANMTTVAAGLAYAGYRPLTYTISSFNIFKTIEQIKLDICYQNLPVIIVGVGSGLGYSNLGTTHHSIEDIGVLNSISNLNIVCPADAKELTILLPQIINSNKPTYLRIGKKNEKIVYTKKCKSKLGEPNIIKKGKDICIFSTGNILCNSIEAVSNLNKRGINPQIVNIHSIKPINEKIIIKCLKKFKKIITVEEHVDKGGLGSILKKICAENQSNNIFVSHNAGNKFLVGAGDNNNAHKILKIDSKSIKKSILKLNKMK